MPELPEVEAARRTREAHCVGSRIARCAVADDPKVVVAKAGVTTSPSSAPWSAGPSSPRVGGARTSGSASTPRPSRPSSSST